MTQHPNPHAFSVEAITEDPILAFFDYGHLPGNLLNVSKQFFELAANLRMVTPRSPERTVMFRKLLEAKDCAVRAAL